MLSMEKCLVSACLIGLCTRYDGCAKTNAACVALVRQHLLWIPFCPEQFGGLPTPRPAARLVGGDGHAVLRGKAQVLDAAGHDYSNHFIRGARMALQVVRMQGIGRAYLKAASPSCGVYPCAGVTAALLLEHGLELHSF